MELVSYYSNRPDILDDLRRTCAAVFEPDDYLAVPDPLPVPGGRDWRLRDRLSDEDLQAIIAEFLAGTPKHVLAHRYSISLSSLKNILRDRGIRRGGGQNTPH